MKTKKSVRLLTPRAVFNFKRALGGQPSGDPTTTLITTTHPTLSSNCS